ncbi:RNA polymerase sigma factor [Melghirimyces algeriensis]|uniref:RNA polymerase sigma-70 factor, ECF subfamily n=1 Tax=Melghirimyces algeriensis TaxID=910412 RepID=A0A521BVZ5_9BACL|nr:sigma-70 family RNA polymerase sigma factor [Melghirimyces algeriensis]SMO50781.1 RNA polymerase sigma-70 factor, ECF subfamily [Melghirimyces algeriensis]
MVQGEWVQLAQKGDREALVHLLRELEGPVYRTACYMMGNQHDAMDVAQEALLRIYRNLPGFRYEARVETWAQRIAVRTAIDYLRKRKRTVPLKEEVDADRCRLGNSVERTGISFDVQEAIHRLPEPQRTAVILRYLHDFTYEEIAETMEIPLNTVKSHLFRARKKLQSWLADYQEGGVLP